jgi:DNA-binding NarL/FixJ family response regulator
VTRTPTNPVRVLIVDDQAPFRAAATAVVGLTEAFLVVGSAQSGEECLVKVRALTPDLVLMDISLPGMDGIEAARQVAALPVPPVVILVSTYSQDEYADWASSSGAIAYIDKSEFGPERLIAAWAEAPVSGNTASTLVASKVPAESPSPDGTI